MFAPFSFYVDRCFSGSVSGATKGHSSCLCSTPGLQPGGSGLPAHLALGKPRPAGGGRHPGVCSPLWLFRTWPLFLFLTVLVSGCSGIGVFLDGMWTCRNTARLGPQRPDGPPALPWPAAPPPSGADLVPFVFLMVKLANMLVFKTTRGHLTLIILLLIPLAGILLGLDVNKYTQILMSSLAQALCSRLLMVIGATSVVLGVILLSAHEPEWEGSVSLWISCPTPTLLLLLDGDTKWHQDSGRVSAQPQASPWD